MIFQPKCYDDDAPKKGAKLLECFASLHITVAAKYGKKFNSKYPSKSGLWKKSEVIFKKNHKNMTFHITWGTWGLSGSIQE